MATDYFSDLTRDYLAKTQKAESSMPGAYVSRWQSILDQQLQKILNREDFKYDFNADPLYQFLCSDGRIAGLSGISEGIE